MSVVSVFLPQPVSLYSFSLSMRFYICFFFLVSESYSYLNINMLLSSLCVEKWMPLSKTFLCISCSLRKSGFIQPFSLQEKTWMSGFKIYMFIWQSINAAVSFLSHKPTWLHNSVPQNSFTKCISVAQGFKWCVGRGKYL